jgi:repressor LexA
VPDAANTNDLTRRQARVYHAIYDSARDRGYQPSIRKVAGALGMRSSNAVVCHLRALQAKGWVGRAGRDSAAIPILRNPDGSEFRGFVPKPREAP